MEKESDSLPSTPQETRIWIIGDQFREKIESDEGQIQNCCIAGGTWFLKRFVEAAIPNISTQIRTYDKSVFHRASTVSKATLKIRSYPTYPKIFAPVTKGGKKIAVPTTNRVYEAHYSVPEPNDPNTIFESLDGTLASNDFLVIEDMAMGFRSQRESEWKSVLGSAAVAFRDCNQPRIIALLGRDSPDLSPETFVAHSSELWHKLWIDHKDHTVVVVNADLLRFEGADISRRIGWEKTAQDFVKELHSRPQFKGFADFAHLVVRFGVTAAIHCFRIEGEYGYVLYYDTKSRDGTFRNVQDEGAIIGNNSVFVACLLKSLLNNRDGTLTPIKKVQQGIKDALPCCQRLFRRGYPSPKPTPSDELGWLDSWPPEEIFDEDAFKVGSGKNLPEAAAPSTASLIARAPVPFSGDNWTIIGESVPGVEMSRLAQRIVFYGMGIALNNPEANKIFGVEAFAPIAGFGKLETLDRAEI